MYLLHFVITPHFRAACQFSSDSSGPVLRTWIFFMSFLYIFEKKNRNFWNFKNVIKIVISDEILHFRCLNPLIRLRQTRFWHKISLFRNFTKFQIFYPTGVVLKPIFLKFSQNWKKISTSSLFQRITLFAHHQRVPDHHDTKMTQKLIKSKKHIFRTPRQTKKFKYLLPRTFLAKMHLLHFVITRHFMAACQFLSDSTGPVLRTWIFSRRPITNRFFFPERRKGTLPYVANDSCPAQTARPPRCHYGVDLVGCF